MVLATMKWLCLPRLVIGVVTGLVLLVVLSIVDAAEGLDDGSEEAAKFDINELDAGSMAHLNEIFEKGDFKDTPELWAEIGLLYKDLSRHRTDDTKEMALASFDRSLSLTESSELPMLYAWNVQRAQLLTDMGRGLEALRALDAASSALESMESDGDPNAFDFDQSMLKRLAGDVFVSILKDTKAAANNFLRAIELYPCGFVLYWKYVHALSDCDADSHQWQHAQELIQNALDKYVETSSTGGSEAAEICTEFEKRSYTSKFNTTASLEEKQDTEDDEASDVNVPPNMRNLLRDEEKKFDDLQTKPSPLYWSLSLVMSKLGQPDRSWYYLTQAHISDRHLIEDSTVYSLDAHQQLTESIISNERAEKGFWPPPGSALGSSSSVPVFIVGFFRSGSTLLETMLDAHPQIWGMGEESVFANEIPALLRKLETFMATTKSSTGSQDDAGGGKMLTNTATRILKRMKARLESSLMAAREETKVLDEVGMTSDSPSTRLWHRDIDITKQRQRLTAVLDKLFNTNTTQANDNNNNNKAPFRIVDKMLTNYRNIGLIHLLFPNAVIIHIMRDPLDTLLSNYRLKFTSPLAVWTLDADTLASEYVMYLRTMQHFRDQLQGTMNSNTRIIDVSYEALISSPELTLRALMARLNLPWNDTVLDYTSTQRTVRTASMLQVRKGLYTHSVGRWVDSHHDGDDSAFMSLQRLFIEETFKPMLKNKLNAIDPTLMDRLPVIRSAASLLGMKNADNKQLTDNKNSVLSVRPNWQMDSMFNYSNYLFQLSQLTPFTEHDLIRILCLDLPECVHANKHALANPHMHTDTGIHTITVDHLLQSMPNAALFHQQSLYFAGQKHEKMMELLQLFRTVLVFLDTHTHGPTRAIIHKVFLGKNSLEPNDEDNAGDDNDVPTNMMRVLLYLQRGRLLGRMHRQVDAVHDFNEALRLVGYKDSFGEVPEDANKYMLPSKQWLRSARCYQNQQREQQQQQAADGGPAQSSSSRAHSSDEAYCRAVITRKLSGVALLLFYRSEVLFAMPSADFAHIRSAATRVDGDTDSLAALKHAAWGYKESILVDPFDIATYYSYLNTLKALYTSIQHRHHHQQQKQQKFFADSQLQSILSSALEVVDMFGREVLLTDSMYNYQLLGEAGGDGVDSENSTTAVAIMARHTAGTYWAVHSIAEECLNDYTLAWRALEIAHSLDRHRLVDSKAYNVYSSEARIQTIMTTQTYQRGFWPPYPSFYAASASAKRQLHPGSSIQQIGDSKLCVFIVGFYRSGSSLLESMLRQHPNIESIGENSVFARYVAVLENKLQNIVTRNKADNNNVNKAADELRAVIIDVGNKILNKTRTTVMHSGPRMLAPRNGEQPADKVNASTQDPKPEKAKSSDNISDFVRTTLMPDEDEHDGRPSNIVVAEDDGFSDDKPATKQSEPAGKQSPMTDDKQSHKKVTRVLDKMLANYMHIGLIRILFPNAVIIHTMRDPLDTILSCYKHRFGSDQLVFTLDWETLTTEYANYLQVIQHFREQLDKIAWTQGGDSNNRIIDVSYEALIASPQHTLRALIYRMGLNWDDAVLNRSSTSLSAQPTVFTASMMQVRRQDLYHSSIGSWRKYQSHLAPVIRLLKEKLKPLKGTLPKVASGYAILDDSKSSKKKKSSGVPKSVSMNWNLDPKFDYEKMMSLLKY
jgi:tetratricopeptide (TPR) repeat protein